MKPLRIFLGDLTYTTVSLANESFPLNIGFVAAYCKQVFGAQVDLRLFKYVEEIEAAIEEAPPDILALSNYPWNHSLGRELMAWTKTLSPHTLCVMGGSNISHDIAEQARFMARCTEVDAHVYLEGERGFSNLVQRALDAGDVRSMREAVCAAAVDGCLTRDADDAFVRGELVPRLKALDELPSPYLQGFMDPFFDGKLSPMVESNRGCPFTCAFCHEGTDLYRKVNFFSTERVVAEIRYIADRVPEQVHNLMFCDPNFAMYARDIEICEVIAGLQETKGWPRDIFASTGKNQKDRIAAGLNKLNGAMQLWISVQSMDANVLKNIKRDNIRLDAMLELTETLAAQGTPSKSEIILGLPGETLQSHLRGISDLVTAKIDSICAYQLMLLDGTEMNTPSERERWGFQTGFRVLPRDFGKLRSGKNVVEIEEVVVATRDLSFEDYIAARRLHLILSVLYNGKGYAALFDYLAERGVDVFHIFEAVLHRIDTAPEAVGSLVRRFEEETRGELWDSEQALRDFCADDESYERLVEGEVGANLLQKYVALSLLDASEGWTEYLFGVVREVLDEQGHADAAVELSSVEAYCRARVTGIFSPSRAQPISVVLHHDVDAWRASEDGSKLSAHLLAAPAEFVFRISEVQLARTRDYLKRFGSTHQGIGKALTKMNIIHIWRSCEGIRQADPVPADAQLIPA
jgi:radical SAM superfamily enzyme YgiQ (UPF0313 family)